MLRLFSCVYLSAPQTNTVLVHSNICTSSANSNTPLHSFSLSLFVSARFTRCLCVDEFRRPFLRQDEISHMAVLLTPINHSLCVCVSDCMDPDLFICTLDLRSSTIHSKKKTQQTKAKSCTRITAGCGINFVFLDS